MIDTVKTEDTSAGYTQVIAKTEKELSMLLQARKALETRIADITAELASTEQREEAYKLALAHKRQLVGAQKETLEKQKRLAVWAAGTDAESQALTRVEDTTRTFAAAQADYEQTAEERERINEQAQSDRERLTKESATLQNELMVIFAKEAEVSTARSQAIFELGLHEQEVIAAEVGSKIQALEMARQNAKEAQEALNRYLRENLPRLQIYPQYVESIRAMLPTMEDSISDCLMAAIRFVDALTTSNDTIHTLSRLPLIRQQFDGHWRRLLAITADELQEVGTWHTTFFALKRKRRWIEELLSQYRTSGQNMI